MARTQNSDFDSAIAADVERVQACIKTATGVDHRFVTALQYSEGGGYPISKFHRDMADPGMCIMYYCTHSKLHLLLIRFSCKYGGGGDL